LLPGEKCKIHLVSSSAAWAPIIALLTVVEGSL